MAIDCYECTADGDDYYLNDDGVMWLAEQIDLLPTIIEAEGYSERELQRDYEASVEYAQYCERYEPTYDPETGAM